MAVTVTAQWSLVNYVKNFDYTGSEQTWTAPYAGYYKLEAWGAEGGIMSSQYKTDFPSIANARPGYGGYSVGIYKSTASKLFINIGGQGGIAMYQNAKAAGGYNGGGKGGMGSTSYWVNNREKTAAMSAAGGGGATHIATVTGELRYLSSNKTAIVIVAGGGGGLSTISNSAGSGGGIEGSIGYTYRSFKVSAATQTTGYAFGLGQDGRNSACIYVSGDCEGNGGGGGGYYGGLSYQGTDAESDSNGSGGSGYIGSSNLISGGGITKHMTCYSCTTSTAANTRTQSNTTTPTSTPTADVARIGNGYARITWMGDTL